ncbi:MAG TPA: EF-hand domain-containing protein [Rhodanobacteraceae bacterium]|nr:EF-hand domain-containing protein [Rhodanobacteraceae bacterium]
MRHTTTIICGIALAAFGACASAQMEQNMPSNPQNPSVKPATPSASKPGSGMVNSGNGLAFGMSADEADRMFSHLDVNHDGYVSRDEFTANGDSGQRFPGCDTNGDGKLSRAEFVQCAQQPPTTGQ